MSRAQDIFDQAFSAGRDPRSGAYQLGVLSALHRFVGNGKPVKSPFAAGTAEADAFWSGTTEGSALARRELDRRALSTTTQTKRAA